jgi:hypothetical protein
MAVLTLHREHAQRDLARRVGTGVAASEDATPLAARSNTVRRFDAALIDASLPGGPTAHELDDHLIPRER